MAVIIGRASIKVIPDTKGFRRAVKRDLDREMRAIEKDLKNKEDNKVSIPAEFDVDERKSLLNFKRFLDKIENQTVKVNVDFDDNLRDLERRIDRSNHEVDVHLDTDPAFRELRNAMERMHGERVEIDLDIRDGLDHLQRQMSDLAESSGRSLRDSTRDGIRDGVREATVDARDGIHIELNRDVLRRDVEWFKEKVRSLRDSLRDKASRIDFGVDRELFDRDMARMKSKVNDLKQSFKDKAGELRLRLNMLGFDEHIHKMRSKLQDLIDDFDGKDIELEPELDHTSTWGVKARLMALCRDRFIFIHVKLKKSSLDIVKRALNGLYGASGLETGVKRLKDLGEWLENIGDNAPRLATVASAVSAIGIGAVGAVGSIGHLANEMVRMSGAGLALPGILGGAAVGLGTFFTAIKHFNEEVPKVGQDLNKIGGEINKQFWNRARVPLLDAWNKVLPSLERGFSKTAKSLGGWTASFSKALGERFKGGELNPMFDNLAKSIDIASHAGKDFADIVEVLGRRGSEYLPRLAQWGNDVTKSFRNWLDNADKTGQLNQWMETGILKMKQFGKLTRETGEFIYLIGKSAERAGFSGLGQMADGMERVTNAMKSLNGQRTLDTYFRGAAALFDGLKSAIGSVVDSLDDFAGAFEQIGKNDGRAIANIGRIFGDLMKNPAFQGGLTEVTRGFADALGEIADASGGLGDLLGGLGKVIGSVARNVGKILGSLMKTLGPALGKTLGELAPKLDGLGDSISGLIDDMGRDGTADLIGWLTGITASSIIGGITALADGLRQIGKAVNGLAGNKEDLREIREELKKFKDEANGDPVAGGDAYRDKHPWSDPIRYIFGNENPWTKMVDWISKSIWDTGSTVVTAVSSWWNRQMESIRGLFTGKFNLGEILQGVLDFGAKATPAGYIAKYLADHFNLVEVISSWATNTISKIGGLLGTIGSWIRDVWNGFIQGLGEIFSGGGSSGPASGASLFGAGGTDLLGSIGLPDLSQIGQRFSEAIENIKSTLSGLWQGFKSWLSGLFGGGGGAGVTGITFVIGAIDNASSVIQSVIGFAASWARNVYQAALTAANRAQGVISGAINQARQWAAGVYRAALTAVSRVASAVSSARSTIMAWARGTYRAVLTALSRVAGGVSAARSTIMSWARGRYQAALTALSRVGGGIAAARSAINGFIHTRFQATISVVAKGIGAVKSAIASIRGKTVNIITNTINRIKNMFANGGIMEGAQKFANGGINFRTGQVVDHRIRMLSENHVAQIAPAGAMRVWAEPETGGEAYIPFAKSKRARSEAILSDVASRFGGEFRKYSNGSTPSRGSSTSGGNVFNMTFPSMKADVAGEVSDEVMFRFHHLQRGGASVA